VLLGALERESEPVGDLTGNDADDEDETKARAAPAPAPAPAPTPDPAPAPFPSAPATWRIADAMSETSAA
jgi:hypothetical protein